LLRATKKKKRKKKGVGNWWGHRGLKKRSDDKDPGGPRKPRLILKENYKEVGRRGLTKNWGVGSYGSGGRVKARKEMWAEENAGIAKRPGRQGGKKKSLTGIACAASTSKKSRGTQKKKLKTGGVGKLSLARRTGIPQALRDWRPVPKGAQKEKKRKRGKTLQQGGCLALNRQNQKKEKIKNKGSGPKRVGGGKTRKETHG